MRRPLRTLVGFAGAAVVAVACSFTSSGAGGPGSNPDPYEGGLLPDGGVATPSSGSAASSGNSSGGANGSPSTESDI
jgi:hypothetical protein